MTNHPRLIPDLFSTSLAVLAGAALLPGCRVEDDWQPRQHHDPEMEEIARKLEARAESLAIRDTVGSVAWVQGLQPMRLRGYGIVVGLGDTGSRECPPDIRNSLVQEMRKRHHLGSRMKGLKELLPAELLNDLGTAVVLVTADIPGVATRGTRMDVLVSALPGTQTKSIEGGYLWRCDLKRFRASGPSAIIQGKTMAYAEGPVFVNPFNEQGEPLAEPNLRRGFVLGGGTVLADRSVRLELREPSFQAAMGIARRINHRYGQEGKVADATSPGTIELKIPPSYHGRQERFLALINHLFLRGTPQFLQQRARALADEILAPDAPHDDIGLAWEALGPGVLPIVRKLYADPRPQVNFFAARTGLRLEDQAALAVLRRHAHDLQSPYQQAAILELGQALNFTEAAEALRPLLSHQNRRVRIMAYRALRDRGDRFIKPLRVGAPNFTIDRVRSDGPPLVFARAREAQRLAVFGEVRCRPPVFYKHPDASFGLHAAENAPDITAIRRNSSGHLVASPVATPLDVVGLIAGMGRELLPMPDGTPPGLNLAYSQVLRALFELSRSGTLEAEFRVEGIEDRGWIGPLQPPGRPETDLKD